MTNTSPLCPWCSAPLQIVWVHGHGQCVRCGTNIDECCRGECVAHTTGEITPPTVESHDSGKGGEAGEEERAAR